MTGALWTPCPRPAAAVRLLCFPYAGGGASLFRRWDPGERIELTAVQLPGREWRCDEPVLRRLDDLVDDLLPAVVNWLCDPRPGIFFGYSMGALLGYALAAKLQTLGEKRPDALFVAAGKAPHLPASPPLHQLSDAAFIRHIKTLGGLADELLAVSELMTRALPVLRADFEALATWRPSCFPTLSCPITAYGGNRDRLVPLATVAEWRGLTLADFNLRAFSGDHFFINTARARLLLTLAADLERYC